VIESPRPLAATPSFIENFSTLADQYDAVLSDVWGVVHNGVVATQSACDALTRFRERGGTVMLITNAPRPGATVVKFIDKVGVPHAAYDGIVSSGDVTRNVMAARPDKNVFHIGPERDLPIFDGLDLNFVPLEQADYVVCTGLTHDDTEMPEDYRALLTDIKKRGLFLLCGNPDLVVERGDKLVYCAGALADLYGSLGGEVLYAGKPHQPIYDLALEKLAQTRGKPVEPHRVLAIGDSVRTDVSGAIARGLDCLFVTAGIHAEELGERHAPDPEALKKMFAGAGVMPTAVTPSLHW
jgi:HAD superfamily hydrolase (TIGR01459 family)